MAGIAVLAVACAGDALPRTPIPATSEWEYSDGLKQFPPDSSAVVSVVGQGQLDDAGAGKLHTLTIRCSRAPALTHPWSLGVSTAFDAHRPGFVIMRFDDARPDTLTWSTLPLEAEGETLLVPSLYAADTTTKLISRMARSKRLMFVYSNATRADSVSFAIDSLAPELAKMDAVCGPTRHQS